MESIAHAALYFPPSGFSPLHTVYFPSILDDIPFIEERGSSKVYSYVLRDRYPPRLVQVGEPYLSF